MKPQPLFGFQAGCGKNVHNLILFTVVTEYKDRIDKLLTETQQLHSADKSRFKDIMDSCIAMKQQVTICQVIILQLWDSFEIFIIEMI